MSAPSDRIAELAQKHLDGEASPAELAELRGAIEKRPELAEAVFRSARVQLALEIANGTCEACPPGRAGLVKRNGTLSSELRLPATDYRPQTTDSGSGPSAFSLQPSSSARRPTRSWTLYAACLAAAALLAISFLYAFDILPTYDRTIYVANTGNTAKEQKLPDGTRLSVAPGAAVEARGRVREQRVRQFIWLTAGEVEVESPKAVPGEIACRVETPDGLWVETVGTTFKVTRAWRNEKGEENVDKTKLAGVLTAVLLVAVTEGEVRTGNAVAEEARVVAGGDAVVRAAEPGQAAAEDLPEAVRKALAEKTSLEFVEQPLDECLQYLQGLAGVNLVIHPDKPYDPKMLITMRLQDVPIETALDWVLQLGSLKREYRNEAIHIVPRGKDEPGPALVKDEAFEKLFVEKAALKLKFDFVETQAGEALDFLWQVCGLNRVLDPACGANLSKKMVTFKGNEMTFGAALDNVLELAGLKREFGKGALYIVPAAAAEFSIECDKPADKVTAEAVEGGALILIVTSPGGIGSAEVKPEKGEWPKKVTVRLALGNLEAFGAECGERKISGRLRGGGKDDAVIERKGDFIEVALPEGFAAGKAALSLSWIDAFR